MSADPPSPLASTLQDAALDATVASSGLEATIAAPPPSSMALSTSSLINARATIRSTVLPRFTENTIVHVERLRYEVTKVLGEGGMGEVALATDHDIGRPVAIKHLHANTSRDASSVARFVEEIRTIGSLEHPNIVPIHDVGVEADGRYFFVMKHVEGETLEAVIEKLNAGDAHAHAEYTFARRCEIMIALLRALQYAHAQGIIHRDIKPANVMVGKYGEVVLMDWGVAKAKKAPEPPRSSNGEVIAGDDSRMRMFTTRHGSLVGTPAYMSPEQARGENTNIDERSDVYSASVLFYELLSLRHYLDDKTTLAEMIRAVIEEEPTIFSFARNKHPMQPTPPAELLHICVKGLKKDPAMRFQSADEMIDRLQRTLDGEVQIQCPFTFTKRVTREMGRLVDRFPIFAVLTFFFAMVLFLFSLVTTVRSLL